MPFFAIKVLVFNENGSISYQKHLHRNEWWFFIWAKGISVEGDKRAIRYTFDTWYIPKKTWHWFRSEVGRSYVLEVQWGKKVSESDIRRK
jgi:mannose-6-phosphate isomerase-like protein (cupin superfamily)